MSIIRRGAVVVALSLFAAGCGSERDTTGTRVALNERAYELPGHTSMGEGCSMFPLERSAGSATAAKPITDGAPAASFSIHQRTFDDHVEVEVRDGERVVARRVYDLAFFEAGTTDEIVVAGTEGRSWLVRHWGAVEKDGKVGCDPVQ